MTALVPTSPPIVRPEYHRRGRPILSGDASADLVWGWRGVAALANHAYAWRVQALASHYPAVGPIATSAVTTSTSCTEELSVAVGQDVAEIEIIADVEDGKVALKIDGYTGAASTATTGRAIHRVATAVTPGARRLVVLLYSRSAGVTATLYGYTIREVPLVAADFP